MDWTQGFTEGWGAEWARGLVQVRGIEIQPTQRRQCRVLVEAKKAQKEKMQNMILEQDLVSLVPPSLLSSHGVEREEAN